MNKNVRYRILIFTLTQVKAMNRTKIGVTDIALEMFAEADDDGSGELSVIEIFCFLPEPGFLSSKDFF